MKTLVLNLIIILGIVANAIAMEPGEPTYARHFEKMPGQTNPSTSQQTVTIQTNDDQEFNVPLEIAKQIPTIKGLIEDIGESEVIPLPNINGEAFNWILQTLQMLQNNPDAPINTQKLTVDQLINFANACEYLELDNLQTKLFETLDERKSSEGNLLAAMNDTALKKFWQQHPAYSYISKTFSKELKTKFNNIVISPDGTQLLSYSYENETINIWDLINQKSYELDAEFGWSTPKALISTNNTKLIFYGNDKIEVCDLRNLNQMPYELEHEDFNTVTISPDGSKLISWNSHEIKIWNMNNLKQYPYVLHADFINGIVISSDSNTLASWDEEGAIQVWNLKNRTEHPLKHKIFLHNVIISPDNTKLISEGAGKIRIWNLSDLNNAPRILEHDEMDQAIISPDGSTLATWSMANGTIKLWNLHNLDKEPHTLNYGSVNKLIISSDNKKLIAKNWNNDDIKIWNLSNLDQAPHELQPGKINETMITNQSGDKLILYRENRDELVNIYSPGLGLVPKRLQQDGLIKIYDLNNLDQAPRELDEKGLLELTLTKDDTLISQSKNSIILWPLNVNELNNLNINQIQLIIWLYENKDNKPDDLANITAHLQFTYKSLPSTIKDNLRKQLPIIQAIEKFDPFVIKHYQ